MAGDQRDPVGISAPGGAAGEPRHPLSRPKGAVVARLGSRGGGWTDVRRAGWAWCGQCGTLAGSFRDGSRTIRGRFEGVGAAGLSRVEGLSLFSDHISRGSIKWATEIHQFPIEGAGSCIGKMKPVFDVYFSIERPVDSQRQFNFHRRKNFPQCGKQCKNQ